MYIVAADLQLNYYSTKQGFCCLVKKNHQYKLLIQIFNLQKITCIPEILFGFHFYIKGHGKFSSGIVASINNENKFLKLKISVRVYWFIGYHNTQHSVYEIKYLQNIIILEHSFDFKTDVKVVNNYLIR